MLKNVVLTAVGLLVLGLARLGFNSASLATFGETTTGKLNVALSLAVLVSLPTSTAFGPAAVRFIAVARAKGQRGTAAWIYRWLLLMTLVLAGVLALILGFAKAPLAASRGIDETLVLQALLLSLAYALYLYLRGTFYALDKVGSYAWLELVAGLAFFIALAGLCWAGAEHWLLGAFLAAYTVFSAGALWVTRRAWLTPTPRSERPSLGPVASFGFFALVGTVASLSVRELAVVFAPDVSDMGGAAHLALSMSLLLPLQFLPRMLRTVIFARSAELDGGGKQEELASGIAEASHWLLFATLPACVLLALLGGPLLEIAGGTVTPERLLAFRLLTAAAFVDVIATPAANGLSGAGWVKVPTLAAIMALVPTVLVWWWLTPTLGIVALALGMLVGSAVKGGVPIFAALRLLRAHPTREPLLLFSLVALSAAALLAAQRWGLSYLGAALYAVLTLALLRGQLRILLGQLERRLGRKAAVS